MNLLIGLTAGWAWLVALTIINITTGLYISLDVALLSFPIVVGVTLSSPIGKGD